MSLSLVAYDSSDEDSTSDSEDGNPTPEVSTLENSPNGAVHSGQLCTEKLENDASLASGPETQKNVRQLDDGHISDDEEFLASVSDDGGSSSLKLPPAKHGPPTGPTINNNDDNPDNTGKNTSVLGLPAPKPLDKDSASVPVLTEDDELEDMVKPKAAELAQRVQPPDKKKKTIKIAVPSLSNFDSDEEDEPVKKKLKPSSKGSGLFALLPEPKHVSMKEAGRALIPHTLTKKPASGPKSTPKPDTVKPKTVQGQAGGVMAAPEDSDEEEGASDSGNYFSIEDGIGLPADHEAALLSASSYSVTSSLSTLPPVKRQKSQTTAEHGLVSEIPLPSGSCEGGSLADEPLSFKGSSSTVAGPCGPTAAEGASTYPSMFQPQSSSDYNMDNVDEAYYEETNKDMDLGLSPEELLKLQGKRKWGREEINIIDVQPDYHTNTVELTKHLTEEVDMVSHSKKKKKDQPTSQQKRKHQITYLAHKAKEREFDLKNQWAQNKMTKRQTQSKYGF